jgi:hypothetical protein
MTPDEIIDQQVEDNHARAEWIHNPAPALSDWDTRYIGNLRELFAHAHGEMLACAPDNDYRRRAEEALELAGMWAIKAITHSVAPERLA